MKQPTQDEVRRIPTMLMEGKTLTQISSELGISVKSVSNYIKRLKESGVEVVVRRGRPRIKLV